jgi:hypothetical protein
MYHSKSYSNTYQIRRYGWKMQEQCQPGRRNWAAGVRAYWIIDPRPGYERADFYVLDTRGQYQLVPMDSDGCYHSTVLAGFWFEVGWVLSATLPDVLQALAQIVGSEQLLAQIVWQTPQP